MQQNIAAILTFTLLSFSADAQKHLTPIYDILNKKQAELIVGKDTNWIAQYEFLEGKRGVRTIYIAAPYNNITIIKQPFSLSLTGKNGSVPWIWFDFNSDSLDYNCDENVFQNIAENYDLNEKKGFPIHATYPYENFQIKGLSPCDLPMDSLGTAAIEGIERLLFMEKRFNNSLYLSRGNDKATTGIVIDIETQIFSFTVFGTRSKELGKIHFCNEEEQREKILYDWYLTPTKAFFNPTDNRGLEGTLMRMRFSDVKYGQIKRGNLQIINTFQNLEFRLSVQKR